MKSSLALHTSTERLFWYIEGLQIQVAARPRKGKEEAYLALRRESCQKRVSMKQIAEEIIRISETKNEFKSQ